MSYFMIDLGGCITVFLLFQYETSIASHDESITPNFKKQPPWIHYNGVHPIGYLLT